MHDETKEQVRQLANCLSALDTWLKSKVTPTSREEVDLLTFAALALRNSSDAVSAYVEEAGLQWAAEEF